MKLLNRITINLKLLPLLIFMIIATSTSAQYVRTSGTRILDGNGNDIFFTGMNLGNWLVWEGYLMMGDFNYRTHTQFFNGVKTAFGGDLNKAIEFEHQWRLNYVTVEAIRDLKGLGFNSVRVPFHFNLFWDYNTNNVSDRGFQYIDRLVGYCRTYGVYILLDMHAAPGHQNPGDHCDNNESNSSQPRGSVHFWDGNNVNIASQVWRHIANRYKNETIIWGYDLINEPVPQPGREYELLRSMKTMRDAIRQVDNNHVIVAEGSWWGSDMDKLDWTNGTVQSVSGVNTRWDNNLVYQTHHYSTDVNALNGRLSLTNRLNVPLMLGEYGESDMTNLRNMTNWCINNGVDYFPWSFKKMSHDKCLWTINPNGPYNSLKNAINTNSTGPASLYNDMISFCNNNIANGKPGLTWWQNFYDAVKNTSTPQAWSVTIQAESNFQNAGIQTENTTDTGGGQNVGWIDAGDWMGYAVNIPSNGSYRIEYRVASPSGGGSLRFERFGGGLTFGTITIPSTGGWQNWTTISHNVNLTAGQQNVAVAVTAGGWNFNWFKITRLTSGREAAELPAEEFGDQISLYPNPTANELTLDGTTRFKQYVVYGLDGRRHIEQSIEGADRVTVNVSSLNAGNYFIRLIPKTGSQRTIQFVKK